ncbi:ABC transporter permease [Paenibacillus sp. P96]|uniref:ABC transporter permease n=1 Tax=Paenibacillus zeirhizosphaerae TaxID=2987519 RepID=A0ABT9FV07_9BACL|nr:ABC transporter permease [Paenibacillus sp. P96]MDP4098568.1 ABC transporter permease [Paenibacillus sp. P96]
MNKMGTVIGFTFRQKARTKSFIWTTIILALLITIAMNIPYLISIFKGDTAGETGGKEQVQLGLIVNDYTTVADELEQYSLTQSVTPVEWVHYPSAGDDKLRTAIAEDQVQGYVELVRPEGEGAFPQVRYASVDDEPSEEIVSLLQSGLQKAKTKAVAGDALSANQIAQITERVAIDSREVSKDEAGGGNGTAAEEQVGDINYAIIYVLMILFFTSAMMTGNMIAAEVTAEKSSRVMEILITSVSPLTQMFGKIIGIFYVGMLQIVVFALVVGGNLLLPHNEAILGQFDLRLADLNYAVLIYGLLFYILGYFLYGVLFAAVGSIVSRTEDLGQAVMPITMLSLVAFYIGIFNIAASDNMLVKVASYIPFTSPTVMLLRIGLDRAAAWEIWISLALLVAAILFFGWLASKIYRTGVLMYGKRPTIKELRKAMKAYKI